MAPRVRLRIEPYDPDARDADGDGIVQEGTAWERPVGTRLLSEAGQEIERGLTAEGRPSLRVVDSRGRAVDYVPSYGAQVPSSGARGRKKPSQNLTSLSDIGYRSIAERGYKTIGEIVNPPTPEPQLGPIEQAQESLEQFVRALPRDRVAPKRGNRDRAFAKADEKAKELVWTENGTFYVVETEREFVVVDEATYNNLLASNDINALSRLASAMPYNKPSGDSGADADIKQALIGPRDINIDDAKYRDAVADIHYNSGNVNDLGDDVFAAALFDESLTYGGDELLLDDGSPVTFESILSGEYKPTEGFQFENRRFRITQLKDDFYEESMYGGLWRVYRFTDKEDSSVWYVKASTYAANDGMLEDVGMRAGSLLDLAAMPDSKHIRISPELKSKALFEGPTPTAGNRQIRWIAMSNVDGWDNPNGEQLSWLDASSGGGIDPDAVDVRDLGQIMAMDYILDNSDRHGGNIMVGWDPSGSQRLAIIDNGLLMGGRTQADIGDFEEQATPEQIRMGAMKRANMTASDLVNDHVNNYLLRDTNILKMKSRLSDYYEGDGAAFIEAQQEALTKLKENLDSLLDPSEFERRNIPLSATERAHLDAVKTVARMRIEMLESYPEMLLDAIAMQATPK